MTNYFETYALSEALLKAIHLLGYERTTKVQEEVLPLLLNEQDVVVKSQTGSGKTAAFAIPICENVTWEENRPQALVLTPTRELALQVQEDFFNIGRFKRIKAVGLYGKAPFHIQQKELKQKTHVVVATPGRLLDHLEQGTIVTDAIRYLVIDEADEMLKMGFLEEVGQIIERLPKTRTTMLFSATLPNDIKALCKRYMTEPVEISISPENVANTTIEAVCYEVTADEKLEALKRLTKVEHPSCCIIFCNRKDEVDKVYGALYSSNYSCAKLHGGMEQKDRFMVMEDFRRGRYRYLVATDVAARGIDIDHITHVINFDVPEDKENYVHRIGRTGRGGRSGKALMLVTPRDTRFMAAIENYVGHRLKREALPSMEQVSKVQEAFEETMHKPLERQAKKGEALSQDILKLHINAGKKTKMRPVDIVGTLCNLPSMSAEDIGIINIQDISTYVEVLNGKGEMVYKLLQKTPIKGRLRRVSKVESR